MPIKTINDDIDFDITCKGDLVVNGDVLSGTVTCTGNAVINGDVAKGSTLRIHGNVVVNGDVKGTVISDTGNITYNGQKSSSAKLSAPHGKVEKGEEHDNIVGNNVVIQRGNGANQNGAFNFNSSSRSGNSVVVQQSGSGTSTNISNGVRLVTRNGSSTMSNGVVSAEAKEIEITQKDGDVIKITNGKVIKDIAVAGHVLFNGKLVGDASAAHPIDLHDHGRGVSPKPPGTGRTR